MRGVKYHLTLISGIDYQKSPKKKSPKVNVFDQLVTIFARMSTRARSGQTISFCVNGDYTCRQNGCPKAVEISAASFFARSSVVSGNLTGARTPTRSDLAGTWH